MALFVYEMIQPSYKGFCALAKQGNLIPLYEELLMDLGTPLSFSAPGARPLFILARGVEGSERWARYSFLGTRPHKIFKARGAGVEIIEAGKSQKLRSAPLAILEELLRGCRPVTVAGVPPFFGGGAGLCFLRCPVEQFHEIASA